MKFLLILSQKPYDGTDVTWNALRMADAAIGAGHEVRIFVMNDAVDIARSGSKPEGYEFDLGAMLQDVEKKGALVKLCTTCINRCGIAKGQLLNANWPAGMKDLVQWTAESDRSVTF
ncbi:MAG: DsrE family protein [Elusimicrobia bacterium]|nr:DsrE family protein [Elusimicrobiota bacterium]